MEKPNILIFMTDQQRGDTIPPYSMAKTPNLDKFCSEGISFSNTYGPSPHCCPARATFFSGLYPSQHGVWHNVNVGNAISRGLNDKIRLWSEDLKDAGYDLYFSGKWHVSDYEGPDNRGFEMGFPKSNSSGVNKDKKASTEINNSINEHSEWYRYKNLQQKSTNFLGTESYIQREGYPPYVHYGVKDNPFKDRDVVNDAINKIKSRSNNKEPWCQFVGTLGPHDPYFLPQEFIDLYNIEDIVLPENFSDKMTDKPALYQRTRSCFDKLSSDEHKQSILHYLAFCTYEDALFGQVLKALEETGEIENTLVIYLSDHGDYMGEHGLWCKGLPCFKSAYHIPFAARWPKGIKNEGRCVEEFVSLADFAPTFLELAGVDSKTKFVGKSLVPFFNNETPLDWRKEVYTQSNGNELYGIQRSVMTKEWKLVYNGYDFDELYDLKNDPYEEKNIFKDLENEPIVKDLYKKMWQFAYETWDQCINPYIMVGLAKYGPGIVFEE